jgi:hypothetical protein
MQQKLAEARAGGLRSAEGEPTGVAADNVEVSAEEADAPSVDSAVAAASAE